MTGMDQDMMQKNLSCKTLRASQRNMMCYGAAFIPVNLLFLALGVLLYQFAAARIEHIVRLIIEGDRGVFFEHRIKR